METEIHIAGMLVHVLPDHAQGVAAALAAWPGVELRAAHGGRLVVAYECADGQAVVDLIARARELPGVVDAALRLMNSR